jgi:Holliday junction resolvase
MVWFILIIIIGGYVFWKFNDDSKKVERRNESFGGMKKMFPEFVQHFENNGFELVENSGSKLVYKKPLTNNSGFNKYLFLGVESKFTNIAFGYVINGNGEKINGLNVEFAKNYRLEEVEMIVRKITGNLQITGVI